MGSVAQSVIAIGIVMLLGWIGRRSGVLSDGSDRVLTDVVYWFLAPAMLFSAIAEADAHQVVGRPLAVAACAGFGTVILFLVTAWLFFRPSGAELALGAMSSTLNNAGYVGIPIATYVLNAPAHGVPVMVFQLSFLSPMFFVVADLIGSRRKPTFWGIIKMILKNPLVIAGILGFLVSWFRISLPSLVAVPIDMIGQAASPVILIAFGCSVYGQRLSLRDRAGSLAIYATIMKLVVQPLLALGAGWLLGLRGVSLMAVTLMAALPTANNAFVMASRAKVDPKITQETILLTTIISLPLVILIVWLFQLVGGIEV